MESEESSDTSVVVNNNTEDIHKSEKVSAFLVQVLKDNQILLDKAQVTKPKSIKRQAVEIIRSEYENRFNEKINTQQILKKISNMKWRTKYKVSLNKNGGNRKYELKDWEKELLELIDAENNVNSTANNIQNQQQQQHQVNNNSNNINNNNNINSNNTSNNSNSSSSTPTPTPTTPQPQSESPQLYTPLQSPDPNKSIINTIKSPNLTQVSDVLYVDSQSLYQSVYIMDPPPTKKLKTLNTKAAVVDNILSKYETDETTNLTDAQLQRLILLKQNLVLSKKLKIIPPMIVAQIQQQQQQQQQQQHLQQQHQQQAQHHIIQHHHNSIVASGGGGIGQIQAHNMHQNHLQQNSQIHQVQLQQQQQQQQQQIQQLPPQQQVQQLPPQQQVQQLPPQQQIQQLPQQQIQQLPQQIQPQHSPQLQQILIPPINGDYAIEIKSRNLSFDEF